MVTTPGRKSSDALVAPSFGPARLSPPADLTEPKERRFFLDLVAAARPDHFQPIDLAVAGALLPHADAGRSGHRNNQQGHGGGEPGAIGGRQAVKAVHDLALRLRVSPQARLSKVNARTARPTSLSYYDRQKLGGSG
jgi:hypothetical protein